MTDDRRPSLTSIFQDILTPAEQQAREQLDADAQRTANTLLLGAIAGNDERMFDHAIQQGANVNADGGKPLAHAAQEKNHLFLRKLMTRGADVTTAVKTLSAEQENIPRKKHVDTYWERTSYTYKSKDAERRYKQITAIVKTINDYEEVYLEKIAPAEAVRLQQQLADDVATIRREVDKAMNGAKTYKPKLSAPGGNP